MGMSASERFLKTDISPHIYKSITLKPMQPLTSKNSNSVRESLLNRMSERIFSSHAFRRAELPTSLLVQTHIPISSTTSIVAPAPTRCPINAQWHQDHHRSALKTSETAPGPNHFHSIRILCTASKGLRTCHARYKLEAWQCSHDHRTHQAAHWNSCSLLEHESDWPISVTQPSFLSSEVS